LPVEVTTVGPSAEPSPIASTTSAGYRLVAGIAAATFEAPVAPLLMIGLTDSRHMSILSDDIYRFQPVRLGSDDIAIVHGIDERISLENFRGMLKFYQQVIIGGSAKTIGLTAGSEHE
jgi:carboxypeptidase PM20D1